MKFQLFLTKLGTVLQVRLGRSEARFNGSVAKTLLRNGVSVGVTAEMEPVFVRLDFTNRRIQAKMSKGIELSPEDCIRIFRHAVSKLEEVHQRHHWNRWKLGEVGYSFKEGSWAATKRFMS